MHLSLWDKVTGKNIFVDEKGNPSQTFRYFLGGWLQHMPDLMPFFAPTINSYKRYRTSSWAPTSLGWSSDNRTAGFRICGHGQSLRIECRIPGADANPYVAWAASVAAGLDGLEKKIEPPPELKGNLYVNEKVARVPRTLHEATERLKASTFAKTALGEDAVNHWIHYCENEVTAYNNTVTDWERKRYFEQC